MKLQIGIFRWLYVFCCVLFACLNSFKHYAKSNDYYLKSIFACLCDRWPANIENTWMVNNTKFIYSKANQNVKLYIWLPLEGSWKFLWELHFRITPRRNDFGLVRALYIKTHTMHVLHTPCMWTKNYGIKTNGFNECSKLVFLEQLQVAKSHVTHMR